MSPPLDHIKAWHREALAWARDTFGPAAADPRERALRFLEEALEVGQSQGLNWNDVTALMERVYSRPAGEARQEVGQAQFTLALLATNLGFEVSRLAHAEFARVRAIPKETWARRHAAKGARLIAGDSSLSESPYGPHHDAHADARSAV